MVVVPYRIQSSVRTCRRPMKERPLPAREREAGEQGGATRNLERIRCKRPLRQIPTWMACQCVWVIHHKKAVS